VASADSAGIRVPGTVLVLQAVAGYRPPSWPGSSLVHLDLAAGDDLAATLARAVRAGAVLASFQPDPRWRVLLDPAGHPFCLTTVTPPGAAAAGGPEPRYHVQPDGLPPANGYSHAVAVTGRLVVISGQVPADAQGRVVGAGDPVAQVRQVFENLAAALAAAGATMAQVVKLTVFLTDLADLAAFRQVRDEYIPAVTPPASSLVQVSGLVNPEFRVEIEALAAI
jgi:reactive intermediate/imine deaminase